MFWMPRCFCIGALGVGMFLCGCDRTVTPKTPGETATNKQPSDATSPSTESTQTSYSKKDLEDPTQGAKPVTAIADNLPTSPKATDAAENSLAVAIQKSDDPDRMIEQLSRIDVMIDKLLISQNQMEKETVREKGIELARAKRAVAQHLSTLQSATPEQLKVATKAQLVALSHLSGLKDVQAAKQLEALARQLLDNPDSELKQQGQVVLFSFAVQNLQNGVISNPQEIVEAANALLADVRFRGRLEMTSLQHAMHALAQMGYQDQISQLQRISFNTFSNSTDQPLRQEAWSQLVANSPAQVEFSKSLDLLGTPEFRRDTAMESTKKLISDFPNAVTLEMLAITVPNMEYAGQAEFSEDLANLIERELPNFNDQVSSSTTQAVLAEHKQRRNWIGRPFEMPEMLEVLDMERKPLAMTELNGKVVLVSFGLTLDLNSMRELPFIDQAYKELHADGFEVIYVSLDQDVERLQKFAKENPKPWKTFSIAAVDARTLTQHFGITMFPHVMLVGRDGKVAKLHVRGDQIREQAKLLLAK